MYLLMVVKNSSFFLIYIYIHNDTNIIEEDSTHEDTSHNLPFMSTT